MANPKSKVPRQAKPQGQKKTPTQDEGEGKKEGNFFSKLFKGGGACLIASLAFAAAPPVILILIILGLIFALGTLGFADRPYLSGSVDSPYDCNVVYPAGANERAMADYINSIIPSGSPLRGMGDHFVSSAKAGNKHPLFIAQFAQKESSWGTKGIATRDTFNPFGRTATSSQPHITICNAQGKCRNWYKFNSWEASIDAEGKYLKEVYQDQGLHTIAAIINKYAPSSENNTQAYITQARNFISSNIAKANGAFGADPCIVAGIAAGPGGPGSLIMTWPIPGRHHITSRFGVKRPKSVLGFHEGVDIGAERGDTVVAAANGTVKYIGGGYGIGIVIDHGNGIKTIYGHFMANGGRLVSEGQVVTAGQPIGKANSTGNSSGDHLHFTVTVNGQYVDPCGKFISC